ncbi:uncharacterized protein EKO05_0005472 [Ascochyta rabiei]|uniref:Uncharacterized protein n=1 Tax=Didymella rabiei TaxID=5454 RepID=A0A163JQ08_DIDRA|nr:uncharacterized protein EKO05_0005472 [Ascochyta rabiei]KZM26506.1 hypothetical protein ST47_g2325 [Ascochyta rabiei]UPX15004.1 hypothetical protein EKO05_0005472 [Ascochyta rabiei]
MRAYAIAAVVFAVFATGSTLDHYILSALAPHTPTASPGLIPHSVRPTPPAVQPHIQDGLELRQAPGLVPIATPATDMVAPEVPLAVLPAPAPALPAADPPAVPVAPSVPANPPAATAPVHSSVLPLPLNADPVLPVPATTVAHPPLVTGDDFVTVQWIETHMGTLRTWIPKTETFHFEIMSQAPPPGVGSIGMGTLTGKTGQTQTIHMVGAAQTPAAGLRKGIAAAVAVGIAGLVV